MEERWIAEARVEAKAREEEKSRAQAEALRQQKLLAALEAKQKADEAASGSGPKGVPKDVRAPEKGKEWNGPHATVARHGGSCAR